MIILELPLKEKINTTAAAQQVLSVVLITKYLLQSNIYGLLRYVESKFKVVCITCAPLTHNLISTRFMS